jgi:sugar/nucleoside kinase (ribokinase family)
MQNHGVHTEMVQHIKKASSGMSFILVCQDNERIIFSNRGANSLLRVTRKILPKLKNTKWIYIASLSGKWKSDVDNIFNLKNVKFAWNPGHFQLRHGYKDMGKYLKKLDVLILNKDEALELVLSNPDCRTNSDKFLNNIKNLIKILHSWGPKIVVITNGKDGATAYDGKKIYEQRPISPKKVVDKTGVGDAFGSSFVAGLEIYKGNIKKALYLGALNSASVITLQGAQNGLISKRQIPK